MVLQEFKRKVKFFLKDIKRNLRLRGTTEEVFTRIYKRNRWRSKESRSGSGSELIYTTNLRNHLPELLKYYHVNRLLDAPCGDFNWMRHVIPSLDIEYFGGDIVNDLVKENQLKFGGEENVTFIQIDICNDPLPVADMMIVRDCLFHLSFVDIYHFFENFCSSDIGLLLTTTHLLSSGLNCDIKTGDYRPIYLFSSPFCFPPEPLRRIKDWVPPHPPREMCLFSKDQVSLVRKAMKIHLGL